MLLESFFQTSVGKGSQHALSSDQHRVHVLRHSPLGHVSLSFKSISELLFDSHCSLEHMHNEPVWSHHIWVVLSKLSSEVPLPFRGDQVLNI